MLEEDTEIPSSTNTEADWHLSRVAIAVLNWWNDFFAEGQGAYDAGKWNHLRGSLCLNIWNPAHVCEVEHLEGPAHVCEVAHLMSHRSVFRSCLHFGMSLRGWVVARSREPAEKAWTNEDRPRCAAMLGMWWPRAEHKCRRPGRPSYQET